MKFRVDAEMDLLQWITIIRAMVGFFLLRLDCIVLNAVACYEVRVISRLKI